ncbi:MAG TPA: VCBS repeat-containing protein [Planctomycetota bacterium]|nr:VCBS repeat-containing protein [Planctomycetota bacterium]
MGNRLFATGSACLLVAASASAQFGDFETGWIGYDTSTYLQARFAVAAVLEDLDGDGDLDLAVANWWSPSRVTVILNRGNGRFDGPAYYPLLAFKGSLDIAAADFDGDGHVDLVAPNTGANYEGSVVSLLRNHGDGTFAAHQTFQAGTGPVGLAPADFDGDGWIDLAVACYGPGSTVALLRNDQAGGFLAPVAFPAGAGPYKLAAGDLNGDGRPDLAVARDKQRLTVLLNDGSGGFAPPVDYPVLSSINNDAYQSIALGDADKDGDLDVFYSSATTLSPSNPGYGAVAILRNHGDGTLAPAEATELAAGGGQDLAVADVTGDGWLDILGVHGSSKGWSVVPGDGSGGFAPLSFSYHPSGENPFAVEVGDVDGDGDLDAVVVNRFSLEANVHRNPGDGDFSAPAGYPAATANAYLDAADVDGDGDLDVAVAFQPTASIQGRVHVLRNQGDGSFAPPEEYTSPQAAGEIRLRDLDGDGLSDLLWADNFPPYDFKTRLNLGNGSFGPLATWPNGTCGNGDIEAFDMDHDGDLDVFLGESGGCPSVPTSGQRVFVNRNRGDGTFDPPYILLLCNAPLSIASADLDGDGHPDLVTNGVCVRLGIGDGTFGPATFYASDSGSRDVVAADLDGDGILDLATCNIGAGGPLDSQSMAVLIGKGNGSFEPPVLYAGSASPQLLGVTGIVAGDVDSDGDLDVMVSNHASNDVSLFRNHGNGTFEPHIRYGAGWGASEVFLGEFTGDGEDDLAVLVSTPPSFGPRRLVILRGTSDDCPDPLPYCTAKVNSAGGAAALSWSGAPSYFCADFQVVASGAMPSKTAVLFFGLGGTAAVPFAGGTLCIAPPLQRLAPHLLDPAGSTSYAIPITGDMPGTRRWYQMWYRDPQHPDGTGIGLTAALEVEFCD